MAPPNVDNMITLKVDNVPFTIAADELRELFDKFGEIGDVYIPRARGSSESRGFAFVRFMNRRDAEDAIEGMEGKEFQGRELRVQFAKQRRPDNPREYYSTRDGRGYDDAPRDRDRDRGYDDRGRDRYDDRDRDRYDDRRRSRSPDRSRDRDSARGGGSYRERSRSPPRRRSRSPPRRRSPSPRRD